jgi:uncharacterized protein YcbK (DUF882 family)
MCMSERIATRAPRLAVAAAGLVAFAIAIPAATQAGPDLPIVEKTSKAEARKPQRRASSRGYRRKARRATELSSARCSAPNSACGTAQPRTLQAYASLGPVGRAGRSIGSTSRNCLAPAAKALLARLEAQFGAVKLVSTCRRGATIAGTRRPSMHRYGKAFDFVAPPGRKAAVVRWLRDHSPGVTMTYYRLEHVHPDVGPYHKVIYGAGGPQQAKRRQARQRLSARGSNHLR